ncbi:MAG: hypothetical protein SPK06_01575 [Kiritimatiellia bacterium]|nr:hypothetical protein [Kiritimatiellia bacterium]
MSRYHLILPLLAVAGSLVAADAGYTLSVPPAPTIRITTNLQDNAWLATNSAYSPAAIVTPGTNALSSKQIAGQPRRLLAAAEAGFPVERTKPEYYLGQTLDPPEQTDWSATYETFQESGSTDFLFDPHAEQVYAVSGGTKTFTWVLADGSKREMTYVISPATSERPRRIYWTDYPYNGPAINLRGKFVKFYGPESLIVPQYGSYTNSAGGIEQIITNRVVSGLYIDPSTSMLYAYGQLQGQVVMAYYETGSFDRILHVQVVEISRPQVNTLRGSIGSPLRPDGQGYDTQGLYAMPTIVEPSDDRGDYLYQHKGTYAHSPKNGEVFPLRPTVGARWNAEVYWMEADEMEVSWPFELDQYENDWPADAPVFVRGDVGQDVGRPIYLPQDYSFELCRYQEPEGHAQAPDGNGAFATLGAGYSMLKLSSEDNIWFMPIRSVLRSDTNLFTLAEQPWSVGVEMVPRGGSVAGTAPGHTPEVDGSLAGYIYGAVSGEHYHHGLYVPPAPDSSATGGMVDVGEDGTTNVYASVICAVTTNAKPIEVWWSSSFHLADMPKAVEVPSLPQVYRARWPRGYESPSIVIASQKGSAAESVYLQDLGLYLDGADASLALADRSYFAPEGGTVQFWFKAEYLDAGATNRAAVLTLGAGGEGEVSVDVEPVGDGFGVVLSGGGVEVEVPREQDVSLAGWHFVSLEVVPGKVSCSLDFGAAREVLVPTSNLLTRVTGAGLGRVSGATRPAREGVVVGNLLFWNRRFELLEAFAESLSKHDGSENHLTGCYTFLEGEDLVYQTGSDARVVTEKCLGTALTARHCLAEELGPPVFGSGVLFPDEGTVPKVYVQNNPSEPAYNPNEEHAFVRAGAGGQVVWALRSDLNGPASSEPGVLVEYIRDGRKKVRWFDVVATNYWYPDLGSTATAGLALPGPHPIDLLDNPWMPQTTWVGTSSTAPVHRDRKGQLWARAAGTLDVLMYYPQQDGFAFPSIPQSQWPQIGAAVPWLSLLGKDPAADPSLFPPTPWTWTIQWPENIPEIEIGRTLTLAQDGLPEVWNAKSIGLVWPPTEAERNQTAILFDPTVEQASGFSTTDFQSIAEAVATLGIKVGSGGNATLRGGRYYFTDLPPSISSRVSLDTTADLTNCLKIAGLKESNPGGVELLYLNILNPEERQILSNLFDHRAWKLAVAQLAPKRVSPNTPIALSPQEERIDYAPRDHYALFTPGATNIITLIENDATNALLNVSDADPISMHLIKVVPKYYTARTLTREDPYNLLSQQLSIIYGEDFAGDATAYTFEWRQCLPHADGTVPTQFDDEYQAKFPLTNGLTRFTIGQQGDTLANMVNTYYTVRYRAASTNSPAYATMGFQWSDWSTPPALAEGWVQRVLNNVTPFSQRMRDLAENEAETPVSMIRQAGAPYEGDIALNQENLKSAGLIQLYETILSKAETMSLSLGINDDAANKQLQLAVARLADLYNLLGDEAYADALNPTIGFGGDFSANDKYLPLDYGSLSSSLFCFDNQVPTLLDEELALLRGRSGENAPSTQLSPYYNRLIWNFTRGMSAGEVAYAVNYDISGNQTGLIDYQQAAEMYPQGHGDAYGHYLSALSGYYRLLRNPCFSWGKPAMGEMVVADAVVNVDYYDEASFAKAACNVATVAKEVVERTALKAYREQGAASGAGYLDSDSTRAFGYGEWASRGGFGALCNWAVANSILPPEPTSGTCFRYFFSEVSDAIEAELDPSAQQLLKGSTSPWCVEFSICPTNQIGASQPVVLDDSAARLVFALDGSGALSLTRYEKRMVPDLRTLVQYTYTNLHQSADSVDKGAYALLSATNGEVIVTCAFAGTNAPTAFPAGYVLQTNTPPEWADWVCYNAAEPYVGQVDLGRIEVTNPSETVPIATLGCGESLLVALRCEVNAAPELCAIDPAGVMVARISLPFDPDLRVRQVALGGGFLGELGEFRIWSGTIPTLDELDESRSFVNPFEPGLLTYFRAVASQPENLLKDQTSETVWLASGGSWGTQQQSGLVLTFETEGLKRIDRGRVNQLAVLADTVPAIQKQVDLLDSGQNPLGLAATAIPFDITPVGAGDGSRSHYEQIRDRAGTALENARKALDKAQASANRLRLLQEAQVAQENKLSTLELEIKNTLTGYFGYPYEGDIGPSGTYPQGYDGPDLYHYLWMDPTEYGLTDVEDILAVTVDDFKLPAFESFLIPFLPSVDIAESTTITITKSASGIVLKPSNITGTRRANGKIQEALGQLLTAYLSVKLKQKAYNFALQAYENEINTWSLYSGFITEARALFNTAYSATSIGINATQRTIQSALRVLKFQDDLNAAANQSLQAALPQVQGAGLTVNVDPSAIANAAISPANFAATAAAKSAQFSLQTTKDTLDFILSTFENSLDIFDNTVAVVDERIKAYQEVKSARRQLADAGADLQLSLVALQQAQKNVETLVAEIEGVIDERTLARKQAADELTKMRYNDMFFRLTRNNALSTYNASFALARQYCYLAAQAYDYETGLLSTDKASGERFLSEIIAARTLGEFDVNGLPQATSGNGDGGLADILSRMDANWLVLKPRLGINNPQSYATWFSLRRELFRILPGAAGDKAWQTELSKYWVDDLSAVPEFVRYCQPLSGSTVQKEPALVIPFPSEISFGKNFFGDDLAGGDSSLDATWFATHIYSAGLHFEGYNQPLNGYAGTEPLSKTPSAYLVPVGADRIRAPGSGDQIISWNVVDQTIPLPYAIGSTELDDPDWTPLFTGVTGGAEQVSRIRKHPSFRAYYAPTGSAPSNDELDCTRLTGRSAWNTRWVLIIPAGSLGADREAALKAFIYGVDADRNGVLDYSGVTDIKLGLKTYSRSGN